MPGEANNQLETNNNEIGSDERIGVNRGGGGGLSA